MKKILFIWTAILFFHSHLAYSETLAINVSGIVTSTSANAVTISEVQPGDLVSGSFTYDTAAADALPAELSSGRYPSDRLQIEIAEYSYEADNNTIAVTNNAVFFPNAPVIDAFEIVSPLRKVSGPELSGLPIAQIDIVIVDTTADVFEDDSLPSSLSIEDFDVASEEPYGTTGGRLIFQSLATGDTGEVRFQIASISATAAPTGGLDGGHLLTSELWAKAELQVPGNPVTLIWKEVGSDKTPSDDRVVSGYFYADPNDFAFGSQYNPEIFVKVYIASNGWANIAFNHVTVDDVTIQSAHNYDGVADQTGSVTLSNRLVEHQYNGVGQQ